MLYIVNLFQQSGLDFVAWLLDIILALNIKSNICDLSIQNILKSYEQGKFTSYM